MQRKTVYTGKVYYRNKSVKYSDCVYGSFYDQSEGECAGYERMKDDVNLTIPTKVYQKQPARKYEWRKIKKKLWRLMTWSGLRLSYHVCF